MIDRNSQTGGESDMRNKSTTGTDTRSGNSTERRRNSRLEVDDPHHCKQCGKELPEICVDGQWHPLGGDKPPEYCGSCLADAVLATGPNSVPDTEER